MIHSGLIPFLFFGLVFHLLLQFPLGFYIFIHLQYLNGEMFYDVLQYLSSFVQTAVIHDWHSKKWLIKAFFTGEEKGHKVAQ